MKMDIDYTLYPKRLKEIRRENKYTQAKLAKKLNTLTKKYNCSLTQIIMGFFLVQDMPFCALAGASREAQLLDFMETLNIPFDLNDFK